VPCNKLSKISGDGSCLTYCLPSMRSLSISISNRVYEASGREDIERPRSRRKRLKRDIATAQVESTLTGLASLMSLIKTLQNFAPHCYCSRADLPPPSDWGVEKLLQHMCSSTENMGVHHGGQYHKVHSKR
jgi:hypothetical protein